MLCPKCGKETRKGLCEECFLERDPIGMKDVELIICTTCNQFRYKGKWNSNLDRFMEGIIRDNLVHHHDIEIKEIDFSSEENRNRLELDIDITGEYASEKFKTSLKSSIKPDKSQCKDCSRRSSGYYEAILQFRIKKTPTDKDVDPRYVAKAEKVRGGYDFYITALKYAKQIAANYSKNGYKTGQSPMHAGVRDGKDFYRFSISIKEPQ